MTTQPQPCPPPPSIPQARDEEFAGTIRLEVDATDVERRIFAARETIPVAPGPMVLLYPQWLPGYHAPQASIELFAGLSIEAGGEALPWRRHPTEVYAFLIDVPDGCNEIEASFQFLSPTAQSQGRVVVSPDLLNLEWNMVVLYPAGHFGRRITIEPRLTLPDGWNFGCALEIASQDGATTHFEPVPLDALVDSPLMAGRHFRRINLDAAGEVRLNIVADHPEWLNATDEQIQPHRELVRQADRLFGARHFDHFDVLLALSEEIGSTGVEHHRSCEAVSIPGYFAQWETSMSQRTTIPHEYVHSWNGKYRRGADSWAPSFHEPIRNSLMWVYEGQTQYWDRVLCARSGLWTAEQALQALAEIAATHDIRAGSQWRPLSDTTRDPIIAARAPLPWPSWQRSEDYYTEGALVWLDVDTRIRELSGDTRSLDDFARDFFGRDDRVWTTSTYTFEDLIATLESIASFDWAGFFEHRLHDASGDPPLDGLARGGYRLVYREQPSEYQANKQAVLGTTDLLYSVGLMLSPDGTISEVLWGGPAFRAGLIAGSQIQGVNGRVYSATEMKRAIDAAKEDRPIDLLVNVGKRQRHVQVECPGGNRFPHLERVEGARPRLDEILRPLS